MLQTPIALSEIISSLTSDHLITGDPEGLYISSATPIGEAEQHSIVWADPKRDSYIELISKTAAQAIVCGTDSLPNDLTNSDKCFIQVSDPRLVFLRIINSFFVPPRDFTKHPSATIHEEAQLSDNVFIGAHTYIGRSQIGNNVVIHQNVTIYDNVIIRDNVTIHAGTVIGADGFGYQRKEDGTFEKFPHIGGVLIEDDVEIGANTCIDRGSLGNTHIKKGAKIDNLVHIAHNVTVGESAIVIALSLIGGSTSIGDNSWLAPKVTIRNNVKIGSNTTIGMGAVVTKNVPNDSVWAGSPARPMDEFLAIQSSLKKMIQGEHSE